MKENPKRQYNYNNSEIEYEEYFLIKENIVYKIIIQKLFEKIKIKSKNYEIDFSLNYLSLLTKLEFETINNAYKFIVNLFEENKIFINNIINKKEMKLILEIENKNKIEMILSYNERNKDFIINEINQFKRRNK